MCSWSLTIWRKGTSACSVMIRWNKVSMAVQAFKVSRCRHTKWHLQIVQETRCYVELCYNVFSYLVKTDNQHIEHNSQEFMSNVCSRLTRVYEMWQLSRSYKHPPPTRDLSTADKGSPVLKSRVFTKMHLMPYTHQNRAAPNTNYLLWWNKGVIQLWANISVPISQRACAR